MEGAEPDQLTRSSSLGTWSLGKPLHRTPRLLTRRADTPHPSRERLLAPFALPLSPFFSLWEREEVGGYISCWNVNQHPFREAGLPTCLNQQWKPSPLLKERRWHGAALLANDLRHSLRTESLMPKHSWHENLLHISPKGLHFCSCYFHQDVHWSQLHAGLPPALLRITPRPPTR